MLPLKFSSARSRSSRLILGHAAGEQAVTNAMGIKTAFHCHHLLAQPLANLGEGLPFPIVQPDAALNLMAQDAVLRHQIFVAEQPCLLH